MYYIANNGDLWASGNRAYLGMGNDYRYLGEIVKITNAPLIETAYNIQNVEVSSISYNSNPIFKGKDGKLYTTGNATIMYRNDIMQASWEKIASNVQTFTPGAYIDKNKNLWVSGGDARILGLGESNAIAVPNYVQVDNANINGKAEKVQKAYEIIAVKTDNNELYVSGLNNTTLYRYNGFQEDKYEFTKLLENVTMFDMRVENRMAISNNKLMIWGRNLYYSMGISGAKLVPTDISSNVSVINKIDKMYTNYSISSIITTDGELYMTGTYGSNNLGMNGVESFTKHTYNFGGEKIKDILNLTTVSSNTFIVLTEVGNLYGWGMKNKLGVGSSSTEIITSPRKLEIENVEEIKLGNGYYIAIKKDGTVWGTGINTSGVLGRWQNPDGTRVNTIYKTAYEWVRCPDLEK